MTKNRDETDAATVGTALHAVIEHETNKGFFKTLKRLRTLGHEKYLGLLEEYAEAGACYTRSSFGTDAKALAALDKMVGTWFASAERLQLQHEDNLKVEWEFDVPFRTFGDVSIRLAGTSDLVLLDRNQLWDWKSAGRTYERWEKQRWAVQPTVYTYAAAQEGLIVPNQDGLYEFRFKVFPRNGGPVQDVPVFRSTGSVNWLEQQIGSMLNVMTAVPDGPWPLNDHGALCGPKWCPFWSKCKGQFVSGETWV